MVFFRRRNIIDTNLKQENYMKKNVFSIFLLAAASLYLYSCSDDHYKSVSLANQLDGGIEITEISGDTKQSLPLKIAENTTEEFEVDPDGEEIKFKLKIDGSDYLLRTGYITDFSSFGLKIFRKDGCIYFRIDKHKHDEKLDASI